MSGSAICRLCGGVDPCMLYPEMAIRRCGACGLVFHEADAWSPELSRELYSEKYFKGEEYRDYVGDKRMLQRNFADRLAELAGYKPEGRLLEVGCAYGFFLELARGKWQVEGIDISDVAIRYARETLDLDVRGGDFLETGFPRADYDVICMWDTVEHLADPFAYLEKASSLLARGGVLALTTGDIGAWVPRFRGRRWRLIHPPTHLYYFDTSTLRQALGKAGLELVHVSHPGVYRSYRSVVESVFPPKVAAALTLGGRLDGALYLNLGDIMLAIARKS